MSYKRNNYDADGKRISIHDIVEYIEQNGKFINQPKLVKLDDDELVEEKRLSALNYRDTDELKLLPTNLESIFSSMQFYRAGVISSVNVPANVDISYVSSILTLLVPSYGDLKESQQINFAQVFIRKFHKASKNNYATFRYKDLGWELKEFRKNIHYFNMSRDLMRYVADFLHVNIFILDIEEDALIYVGNKFFTKFKKNLFLLKVEGMKFEPIFTADANVMDHTSPLIKKLINSRFLVERMDCDMTHEDEFNFIVGEEDLSIYFDEEDEEKKKEVDNEDEDSGDLASDVMNGFEEDKEGDGKYDIADGVTDRIQFSDDSDIDSNDNEFESSCEDQDQESDAKKKAIVKSKSLTDNVNDVKNSEAVASDIQSDIESEDEQNSTDEGSDIPSESDDDYETEDEKDVKVTTKNTVAQLKEIAKDMGIKLTYKKNGKSSSKTKAMLIKDINSA